MHKCTQEDYAAFYPPRRSDKQIIEVAIEKMGLYCLDEVDQDMILWGQNNFEYQRLEIMYIPCTPNNKTLTCMDNSYNELLNYVVTPNFYMVVNQ